MNIYLDVFKTEDRLKLYEVSFWHKTVENERYRVNIPSLLYSSHNLTYQIIFYVVQLLLMQQCYDLLIYIVYCKQIFSLFTYKYFTLFIFKTIRAQTFNVFLQFRRTPVICLITVWNLQIFRVNWILHLASNGSIL